MGAQYYIRSNKFSLQERQTRRGRVYDVVFRVVTLDGIEKQKKLSGYTTKALAKNAYLQFVTDCCTFRKNAPLKKQDAEKRVLTVDDLFPEYIAAMRNQNKESTIYDKYGIYKRHIAPALGGMAVESLTKETLYRWQDGLWRTKNHATNEFYSYKHLTNIRSVLHAFLTWAETRCGFVNNLQSIPKPKKRLPKKAMQFWTKEQFEQFISSVDDPMYHALFTLLFYTGRRKGEALALSPADIQGSSIVFNKSLTRKTLSDKPYAVTSTKAEKSATIPICKRLQDELSRYKGGDPFYFGGERPIAENTLTRRFAHYCAIADVPRIRIHDLRHSFVSMLIHLKANYNVIADLISDDVEQVIKTYGHLYLEDKQKVIGLLD